MLGMIVENSVELGTGKDYPTILCFAYPVSSVALPIM